MCIRDSCKVADGHASIDPIAGTAFRTGNVALDRQRTEALLADPKENAEHVMLVDLARNDLSRNAHDVQVDFYKEVQYYSHVIHLVSRVSGEIDADSNPIKTYIDTFPAGTLSGAPKVRAMQLITDIEKHNRGAYGGCIGFIGFDGDLNQAITIRTFVSRGNVPVSYTHLVKVVRHTRNGHHNRNHPLTDDENREDPAVWKSPIFHVFLPASTQTPDNRSSVYHK